MFKTKSDFALYCKLLAKSLGTIVEVKHYNDYGFSMAAFMTDHFGGTYCNIRYTHSSGDVVDTFDKELKVYRFTSALDAHIAERKANMESRRDLNEVSEMINAEY